MIDEKAVRDSLKRLLDWEDARVGFDAAVSDVAPRYRGRKPPGAPHTLWQLVEHIRLAQHDILDFSINAGYREMKWPDDYWPRTDAPPAASAWARSIAQVQRDRRALQRLAANRRVALTDRIPHGSGQTYLRELLLVADHTAYHVGQLVDARRALGVWS
jgi:uncharacterized damage-inducible protein DinB